MDWLAPSAPASKLLRTISYLLIPYQELHNILNARYLARCKHASDPVMASAAIDRLLHKSTVLNIRGDSYRMKEKRGAGAPRADPPNLHQP